MNAILAIVIRFAALSADTAVYVDRVESDYGYTAVVCGDVACINVPTVAPRIGGLTEGRKLSACETVGPRLDGTRVVICNGSVAAYIDVDGSRRANPYYTAGVR